MFKSVLVGMTVASILGGCAEIKTELHHSGGLYGQAADQVMGDGIGFTAANHKIDFYRAVLIFAMLEKAGARSLNDPNEVNAFISYTAASEDDLQKLSSILVAPDCDDAHFSSQTGWCQQLFEAELPKLEQDLTRLGSIALSNTDAKKVFDDMRARNLLVLAIDSWTTLKQVFAMFHSDAALYRAHIEMLAKAVGCDSANTDAAFACLSKKEAPLPNADFQKLSNALLADAQDSCDRLSGLLPNESLPTAANPKKFGGLITYFAGENEVACTVSPFSAVWR